MSDQRPVPNSVFELFYAFTVIALQGFGGVLAIIERELVDKKGWLSKEEFLEEWAVAQVLPGPNVVNLSMMVGDRYFGLRGALASLAGMLVVPSLLVLVLGILYRDFSSHPGVVGATRGLSAVAAGLIIATGLRLLIGLKSNPLGKVACSVLGCCCFIGVALLRWPLLNVLLLLGPIGYWIAYRRFKG